MRSLIPVILTIFAMTLSACVDDTAGGLSGPRHTVASPGEAVMRVEHSETMPNIFGGNDILGRTRPTGTTTVFLAATGKDSATFRRQDVDVISDKTTVNTSATVIPLGKNGSDVLILPPNTPQDRIGGMRETSFTLTTSPGRNVITIDGHTLTLLSVAGNQISYSAN